MGLDSENELVAERLVHALDLLRGEIRTISAELAHQEELNENRLTRLEKAEDDHETRIRSLQDGVTSFKVWSGLGNAGAGILSVVAIIRTSLLGSG